MARWARLHLSDTVFSKATLALDKQPCVGIVSWSFSVRGPVLADRDYLWLSFIEVKPFT